MNTYTRTGTFGCNSVYSTMRVRTSVRKCWASLYTLPVFIVQSMGILRQSVACLPRIYHLYIILNYIHV